MAQFGYAITALCQRAPLSGVLSTILLCPSLTIDDCYAETFTDEFATPNSDLLPSLLFKLNENQLALEAL
ncbi:hypothetical protein J3D47_002726 [Pseudomonas laurylsulfativorans]|nr:hypothetical protein [Pseudomonas laurylsulfativorans]